MKTKKTCAILIAAAFVVSAILSCALLFSVRRIEVKFIVSSGADVAAITEDLEQLKGKSEFSFSKSDAEAVLEKYPYYFLSEEPVKRFPNVVVLTIKERREVYRLINGEQVYILDQDGYLLSIEKDRPQSRELIDLTFDGITITGESTGKVLAVSDNDLFFDFLDAAKSVDLTDNVKSVKVLSATERKEFFFETYTGVTVEIMRADFLGKEQAVAAFESYNNAVNDYYKWTNYIRTVVTDAGDVDVSWSSEDIG